MFAKVKGQETIAANWRRIFPLLAFVACGDSTGPRPSSVVVEGPLLLSVTETRQFEVSALDATGSELEGVSVVWSSSDSSIATVSGEGFVTGVKKGAVTIRVDANGFPGSLSIAVVSDSVSTVQLESPETRLEDDGFANFKVVLRTKSGMVVDRPWTWTSSDTLVGTVDGATIRATGLGEFIITVVAEGVAGSKGYSVDANFTHVSSWLHTCVVTSKGNVYCWGRDTNGERGRGPPSGQPSPPAPTWRVIAPVKFASVYNGDGFSCALSLDSLAYCWGVGDRLGRPSENANTGVLAGPVEGEYRFKTLAVGRDHSCGVIASGETYCWGGNSSGKLGIGRLGDQMAPVRVNTSLLFESIHTGKEISCGLLVDGAAYCWGGNASGERGDSVSAPRFEPTDPIPGFRFVSFSVGRKSFTCGATTEQEALCWGTQNLGEFGNGQETQKTLVPVPAATGIAVKNWVIGFNFSCVTDVNDRIYCMGQFIPFFPPVFLPILQPTVVDAQTISAGAFVWCAFDADGILWCLGNSPGDGSAQKLVPVRVSNQL